MVNFCTTIRNKMKMLKKFFKEYQEYLIALEASIPKIYKDFFLFDMLKKFSSIYLKFSIIFLIGFYFLFFFLFYFFEYVIVWIPIFVVVFIIKNITKFVLILVFFNKMVYNYILYLKTKRDGKNLKFIYLTFCLISFLFLFSIFSLYFEILQMLSGIEEGYNKELLRTRGVVREPFFKK